VAPQLLDFELVAADQRIRARQIRLALAASAAAILASALVTCPAKLGQFELEFSNYDPLTG